MDDAKLDLILSDLQDIKARLTVLERNTQVVVDSYSMLNQRIAGIETRCFDLHTEETPIPTGDDGR